MVRPEEGDMVKLSTSLCLAACDRAPAAPTRADDDAQARPTPARPVDAPPDDEFDDRGLHRALLTRACRPTSCWWSTGPIDGRAHGTGHHRGRAGGRQPAGGDLGMSFFPSAPTAPTVPGGSVAVPMQPPPASVDHHRWYRSHADPYSQAIKMAGFHLASLTDGKPRYVMLVTDGIPNCAPQPNCMPARPPKRRRAGVKDNADYYSATSPAT
jgi:hypothetical protein